MSADLLAVCLGLFSALSLATVNLVVKASQDILMARTALSVSCALIVAPLAFFVPFPSPEVWGAFAISVPIHFGYQMALIRAMHRGDLSLVFPVMRGLAPLLVGLAGVIFLHETLSLVSWTGLVISVLAVVSFGFLRGQKAGLSTNLSRGALFWAAMTAVGVMAYTISDARGIRLAEDRLSYVVWLFMLDSIGVTIVALVTRRQRFWPSLRPVIRNGAISGLLSVLSFGAALYGLSLVEAARITALRESAVIFGALMGWLILRENMGPRRIIASIILVAGLAIMELGA